MRIRIIGPPGSGKSYLSRKLSQKTGVSYVDLDDVHWKTKYTRKNTVAYRKEQVRKHIKPRDWIIEGVYMDTWAHPTISQADMVIVLRPPKIVLFYRLISRFCFTALLGKRRFDYAKLLHLLRGAWYFHEDQEKKMPPAKYFIYRYADHALSSFDNNQAYLS